MGDPLHRHTHTCNYRMLVVACVIVNCGIYSDGQDSPSKIRSVRVPDRHGWTKLVAMAVKMRWKTARITVGETKTAVTAKTSQLYAKPIYRMPSVSWNDFP